MRNVLKSNSEVGHSWANQSQSAGRSDNMFFEGTKIYSYGYHYLVGQIHKAKGGAKFALINSTKSSMTTESKHKRAAWNGVIGLMPCFDSPDPTSISAAIKYQDSQVTELIQAYLKALKITDQDDINRRLKNVITVWRDANELRELVGRKPLKRPTKEIDAVRKHLKARLKRYHELNTPEMLAQREQERLKREAAKQVKIQEQLRVSIVKFRTHDGAPVWALEALNFELLRITGDTVETTRGAVVPLAAAKTLLQAIVSGKPVVGAKVGDFEVRSVTPTADFSDEIVQVGCHKILLSEAKAVLEAS